MTGRGQREGVAAEFLRDVLAGGALGVTELEVMARAAKLLGEGQRITHVKVFKKAKKSLGIRSVRNGFGDAGEWLWRLERQPASPVSKPLAQPPPSIEDTYAEALEEVPPDVRARRIPSSWIDGVERLQYHRPMTGVPQHRWRQFIDDCNNFLSSKQAERAAELGWNARHLFGSRRDRPLMHPGGAGLLWAINGGRLVELHRDWAVIELPANGSRRVFERRRVDAGNVTLPWIEWGRVGEGSQRIRFSSAILPPYARRSKSLEVLIPILYLKGISTGDFEEALAGPLGNALDVGS